MNKQKRSRTSKSTFNVLLVPLCLMFLVSIAQGQSTKEKIEKFEAACVRIMHGPAPIYRGRSKLELEKYWGQGFDQGLPFFVGLIPLSNSTEDRKTLAVAIKNQIGRVGTDAYGDFRMFLGCGGLLQPITRSPMACRALEREKGLSDDDIQSVRDFGWLRSVVAETQVRDWLKSPEKLERMVWFVCWKDQHVRDLDNLAGHASTLNEDFGDPEASVAVGAPYWENARAFLLLACLTSRTDLYLDADPEKLQGRFRQWREWFSQSNDQIRASQLGPFFVFDKNLQPRDYETDVLLKVIPQVPFPDWGALPPALPPDQFTDISEFVR